MRMARALNPFLVIVFFLLSLSSFKISYADDASCPGGNVLIEKYRTIENKLEKSSFGIPVFLESSVGKNASRADIYGIIKYPFDVVQKELLVPPEWCDIVLLHINVRACTFKKPDDTWLLTIYNVNRFYHPLKDAHQMKFEYRIIVQQPGYFDISLTAPEGPFSTKEHRFGFEATPIDEDRTFVHLSYSYNYTFLGYLTMKSYLAIFGRSKIGFTTTGTDDEGNAVFVRGPRAAIERNAVRYYLAILAYLDTVKMPVPVEQRFEKRLSEWYDLTARYKRQLFEIEKEDYLARKRQDQKNQLKLQSDLGR